MNLPSFGATGTFLLPLLQLGGGHPYLPAIFPGN